MNGEHSPIPVPAVPSVPSAAGPPAPSRLPLVLSGLIFPGAGQVVQRRWVAAVLYGGGTVAAFVMFMVAAVQIVFSFYSLGFAPESYQSPEMPIRRLVVWFFVTLLIYLASLLDTYIAYRRDCTAWAMGKLESKIPAR
jgi:hypothetical protein